MGHLDSFSDNNTHLLVWGMKQQRFDNLALYTNNKQRNKIEYFRNKGIL